MADYSFYTSGGLPLTPDGNLVAAALAPDTYASVFAQQAQRAARQAVPATINDLTGGPIGGSPAEVENLRRAYRRDLGGNAALSAGLGAVQMATLAVPTAQDRRNRQKIAELQKLESAGRLGLSGSEAELYDQALGSVRALAQGSRRALEAREAATGARTSAATLDRARRAQDATVAQEAAKVGLAKAAANVDARARQLQELESRLAQKSDRQKQVLETVAQTAAGLAPVVGAARAGRAVQSLDTEKLKAISPDMQIRLIDAVYSHPMQADTIAALYGGKVGV